MNRTIAAVLAASCLALTGCAYSPGGAGVTNGVFTYVSTAHLPTTVAVVDTRTSQQVLVVDVPVGQQLVLNFYGSDDEAEGTGTLRWGTMPAGRSFGGLSETMQVPPASSRRIDVSYRRSPEYPRPLALTKPAELPKGVTIADAPGSKPATTTRTSKPVEVEVTSPKAPKVDIPE